MVCSQELLDYFVELHFGNLRIQVLGQRAPVCETAGAELGPELCSDLQRRAHFANLGCKREDKVRSARRYLPAIAMVNMDQAAIVLSKRALVTLRL